MISAALTNGTLRQRAVLALAATLLCVAVGSSTASAGFTPPQATTTSLSVSPTSADTSTPVTLTATVAGTTSRPTGTVTFSVGTAQYDAALSAGGSSLEAQATYTLPSQAEGSYSVVAAYQLNFPAGFLASHSATTTLAISPSVTVHPTTVTLTSSPSALVAGQSATFTAVVTQSDGNGATPTGSVSFSDNGLPMGGSVTLDGTGTATLAYGGFTAGANNITASYASDDGANDPSSTTVSASVASPPGKHPTALSLTSSPTSIVAGRSATFTAVVSRSDGDAGIPTGTVAFSDNGVPMGSPVALDGTGAATLAYAGFIAGPNGITASYSGDGDDLTVNSSPFALSVSAMPTAVQTTITASAAPATIAAGAAVVLSAHVVQTGTQTSPPQGDVVSFSANNVFVAQAPLDADGTASVRTTGWRTGHYAIAASFVGDGFAPSSASFAIDVLKNGLTVTGPSPSMLYGGSVPTLMPSYSGFANGDTPGSLGSQATCTTDATSSSPAGTYSVTCDGASDPDYAFTYVPGTLTVGKATLAVKPNDAMMIAGQAVPVLTASLSGFLNGQSLSTSGVTGTASCTTTANSLSPAGTYPITCSQGSLSAGNYDFAVTATGTLTVSTSALVTVTAPSPTMVQGDPLPALTPTYRGFVNGDTAASLQTQATCTTTAVSSSDPGTYPVTCGGASDPSYTFVYVAGTLTVTSPTGACHGHNDPPTCDLLASPAPAAGATVQAGATMTIFYVANSRIGTGSDAPTAVLDNGESLQLTVTPIFVLWPYQYVDDGRWTWGWFQDALTFSLPSHLRHGDHTIVVTAHDAEGDVDQWTWPITVASSGNGGHGGDHGGDDDHGGHGGGHDYLVHVTHPELEHLTPYGGPDR